MFASCNADHRSTVWTFLPAVLLVVAWTVGPRTVEACSCGPVEAHEIIVGDRIPLGSGFGIWHTEYERPEVTVVDQDGVALPVEVVITGLSFYSVRFTGANTGDTIHVTSRAGFDHIEPQTLTATVTIDPALPTDLAVGMELTPPRSERTQVGGGSSCAEDRKIRYVDVEPSLPLALEPYVDTLQSAPRVTGTVIRPFSDGLCRQFPPSTTLLGRHKHRVWTACDGGAELGLDPGNYDVGLDVWLPGSGERWQVPAEPVNLNCGVASGCGCSKAAPAGTAFPLLLFAFTFLWRRPAERG